MSNAEPHDLLNSRQVADLAAVTQKTVAEWAKKGQLASIRLPGGDLRFRRADVVALLTPSGPTEAAS